MPVPVRPRAASRRLPSGRGCLAGDAAVLAITTVLIGLTLTVWLLQSSFDRSSNDFSWPYTSALLWRQGHFGNVYDLHAATAMYRHVGTTAHVLQTNWTPTAYVLIAPFTLLPLIVAAWVWSALQLGLMAGAAAIAVRAAPWKPGTSSVYRLMTAAAALASGGMGMLLYWGSWDGVIALTLALSYRDWRMGHRGRATMWVVLGAGLAKPHLVIGILAFLLAYRDRRILVAVLATAGAIGVACVALVGPTACIIWVGVVMGVQYPDSIFVGLQPTIGLIFGAGTVGQTIRWLLTFLGIYLCGLMGMVARNGRVAFEPAMFTATSVSVITGMHVTPSDMALLAPALVVLLGWLSSTNGLPSTAAPWSSRIGMVMVLLWFSSAAIELEEAQFLPLGVMTNMFIPYPIVVLAVIAWRAGRPQPSPAPVVAAA